MDALQARIDSFLKSKRVKKPTAKQSSATVAVKWPHPDTFKATPTSLADAGFYFNPSWEDRDNVTCFMCGKEIGDWDESDDPFDIHWDKCRGTCPWAIVRCGLKVDVDEDGDYVFPDTTRLPSSKAMEKARLDTFTSSGLWPHDAVKKHGANSKKMSQAGFVFTPQSAGDDTASCLYCNVALSGWDDDDDPM
ncbi:hypothetical protein PLICRDRAFT_105816 [Plicaturopsis crispa FD-325 SS-3]|nr:hypothetical protein PLICRDRAFT_105816 [Plicaturopsis crispa FD-325 SS-3]